MKTIFAALALSLCLYGCAGLATPFINNPYAGTYSGTFAGSDGKAGPATMQLTKLGNVFGNLTDTASSQAGTMNGSVDTHLVFNATVQFPSSAHAVAGKLTSTNGVVSGTLTSGDGYTITLHVTKQ